MIERLLRLVGRWARKPVNHTSWVAVVTPTDRPKSVRNRFLIELFCGVVWVVALPFWHFCWCRGFCHRTESDLFLFLFAYVLLVETNPFPNLSLFFPDYDLQYPSVLSRFCFHKILGGAGHKITIQCSLHFSSRSETPLLNSHWLRHFGRSLISISHLHRTNFDKILSERSILQRLYFPANLSTIKIADIVHTLRHFLFFVCNRWHFYIVLTNCWADLDETW